MDIQEQLPIQFREVHVVIKISLCSHVCSTDNPTLEALYFVYFSYILYISFIPCFNFSLFTCLSVHLYVIVIYELTRLYIQNKLLLRRKINMPEHQTHFHIIISLQRRRQKRDGCPLRLENYFQCKNSDLIRKMYRTP